MSAAASLPTIDPAVIDHVVRLGTGEAEGSFLRIDDVAEMTLTVYLARRCAVHAIELAEECVTELLVLEDRLAEVRREARRLMAMADRYGALCMLAGRRVGVLVGNRAMAEIEEWTPDPIPGPGDEPTERNEEIIP